MVTWLRWAMAVLAILLAALPGVAAPAVQPESRVPRLTHYDRAARRVRMPDWGTGYDNRQAVHVFLRISERSTHLTVGLPPGLSRGRGEEWFRELVDALGWTGAELYSSQQAGGLYLRARVSGLVRETDWSRPQSPLDIQQLRAHTARLTSAPLLLAVRVPSDAIMLAPAPAFQGAFGEERYAFFRLSNPAPIKRLTLRYGAGARSRWRTALGAAGGIWLLLPLAALLTARAQLRRRPGTGEEAGRNRLREYRRWHRGILLATFAGGVTTLYVLGFTRVVLLIGRYHPSLWILAFTLPIAWLLVLGRLIGLPLERQAYPIRASLPWYRAVVGELVGASALLIMPLFFTAVELITSARLAFAFPAWLTLRSAGAVLCGCMAVGAGGAMAWSREKWRRRKEGLSREPEVAEDVRRAIIELTTRLETPVSRCYVIPTQNAVSGVLSVMTRDGVGLVTQDLVEQLRPSQVASLVAAAALSRRVGPRDRLVDAVLGAATALPIILVIVLGGYLLLGSGRPPGWLMPTLMISAMSTGMVAMVSARRIQQRTEDADVAVADALDPPRQFLDTLRQLEELQAATTGMDPGALENNPIHSRRRTRLQERLGLD